MRLWMDVMRDLESVMDNHERLFDAWAAGGVDGLVVGPVYFDAAALYAGARYVKRTREPTPCFDPNPEVYRRLVPEVDAMSLITDWAEQVHIALATSNEILDNLFTLLGDRGAPLLCRTPVVVVSERGMAHACEKGCEQVIIAQGADEGALVSAMLQWAEGVNL